MARVSFAPSLRRHTACPDALIEGATVREVLENYFALHEGARGYVLDEHGAVRKHVAIFVGDAALADRAGLGDAIAPDAELWIMQALSGGT